MGKWFYHDVDHAAFAVVLLNEKTDCAFPRRRPSRHGQHEPRRDQIESAGADP